MLVVRRTYICLDPDGKHHEVIATEDALVARSMGQRPHLVTGGPATLTHLETGKEVHRVGDPQREPPESLLLLDGTPLEIVDIEPGEN